MRIPIHHLVPDLFLTDLPQHLKCDSRELLFDPADPVAFSDSGGCPVRGSGRGSNDGCRIRKKGACDLLRAKQVPSLFNCPNFHNIILII